MKMVYHMLDKCVHVIFMMICIFSIKFFVEDSEVVRYLGCWVFDEQAFFFIFKVKQALKAQ